MANLFRMPQDVFLGKNALETAIPTICTLGKKALIVTGKSMIRQGNVDKLQELLNDHGVSSVVFSEIPGEPTDCMIEAGFTVYREEHCDFLIGFGGGSPLDSAKAIGILAANPGALSDFNGKVITTPIPPVVEIPSTAGTGSEVTPFTIITDTKNNIKMLLKGPALMPRIAVVDPMYSMSTPKSVTVATGLDALTHAVEAFTSRKAFAETDLFALSAVKRIFKNLPAVIKNGDDPEAREEMAIAAFEAGVSFSNSSVTIVHGMSRPIGALFHVPHGISNAMLLEACMRNVMDGALDRFAVLGREIDESCASDPDAVAAESFMEALGRICKVCEVPTLSEYGLDHDRFVSSIDKMAEDAMASGSPSNTRMPVTKEDCIRIYRKLIG